jgi:hypothetical protein
MDEELANLQNDIVAVCTTNMLQKVEAQKKSEEESETVAEEEEEEEIMTTLSRSSSSSSSNSSTLETAVVELPNDVLMAARKVLGGPTSPQLALDNPIPAAETTSTSSNTTSPEATTALA